MAATIDPCEPTTPKYRGMPDDDDDNEQVNRVKEEMKTSTDNFTKLTRVLTPLFSQTVTFHLCWVGGLRAKKRAISSPFHKPPYLPTFLILLLSPPPLIFLTTCLKPDKWAGKCKYLYTHLYTFKYKHLR